MSCYQNGGIERLIRGCIEKAIDITDFEYDATWQPDTMRLAMGLRSKRDQIIHFDGVQHAIEKGEFLSVLNSYRYPAEFVVDAASEAGWDHVQTWSATGRVHYQLYETKRL
ncbi:MAG: L-histidine N(alpha)-methyltransferase [Alphaproteobacteria bacterium]|nr:L-histidine N(alpha)-methyltransferase [Alphaproteobacteria bacterium]